jgi:hypothetical protein
MSSCARLDAEALVCVLNRLNRLEWERLQRPSPEVLVELEAWRLELAALSQRVTGTLGDSPAPFRYPEA